jgi:hypothetical protein
MGGKAIYRCRLGMLKVNNLSHSYINKKEIKNCTPTGECLNNNQ